MDTLTEMPFGAVPFHLPGNMGDMLAQVDDSAPRVLPISED